MPTALTSSIEWGHGGQRAAGTDGGGADALRLVLAGVATVEDQATATHRRPGDCASRVVLRPRVTVQVDADAGAHQARIGPSRHHRADGHPRHAVPASHSACRQRGAQHTVGGSELLDHVAATRHSIRVSPPSRRNYYLTQYYLEWWLGVFRGGGDAMTGRSTVWVQCGVAAAATVGVAVAVGVPSAIVSNPWFVRMTPVPWWSYVAWVMTAVISGALVATFVGNTPVAAAATGRTSIVATIGSALAVGCPVCNKLVVAALGVGGALNFWAPLQPLIAVASVTVLGWALWRRISARRACPVRASGSTREPAAADVASEFEH